jgi:cobyrinic acid a,c-diamide synthase
LAKLLDAPVVLVVNAAKVTRTVAAIVNGCRAFDPDVAIEGVILNRVAGERHLKVLSDSITKNSGAPVVGAIPALGDDSTLIPGRHLGLVTPSEFRDGANLESKLRGIAESLDVDRMIDIARSAGPITADSTAPRGGTGAARRVRIGYFKDTVFTFYYPENLEALEAGGAKLIPVSSLEGESLPKVDGLYIGGGFPETHAEQITRNRSMMDSVRDAAVGGLPVYAECGGLIYLARSLRWNDTTYPMSGLIPIDLDMHRKPVGHGYTLIHIDAPNPFYPIGTSIRGHEFHYSGPMGGLDEVTSCMTVESGVGLGGARDGIVVENTLASYTHIHADGVTEWAKSIIKKAAEYAATRTNRAA